MLRREKEAWEQLRVGVCLCMRVCVCERERERVREREREREKEREREHANKGVLAASVGNLVPYLGWEGCESVWSSLLSMMACGVHSCMSDSLK